MTTMAVVLGRNLFSALGLLMTDRPNTTLKRGMQIIGLNTLLKNTTFAL